MDRDVRRINALKQDNVEFKGNPSVHSMVDGQVAIGNVQGERLALYSKKGNRLWKTYLTTDGSTTVDKDLDIKGILKINGTALNEYIADTAGAMFSSNTESDITVTYQDADNTIDLDIDDVYVRNDGNDTTSGTITSAGFITTNGSAILGLTSGGTILDMYGNNIDLTMRLGHSGSGAGGNQYGFYWKYMGSQSGNDNDMSFFAENQTSSDVEVWECKQDGALTFKQNVTFDGTINGVTVAASTAKPRAIFTGHGGSSATDRYLKTWDDMTMTSTKGYRMHRAGSIIGVSVNFNCSNLGSNTSRSATIQVRDAGSSVFTKAVTIGSTGVTGGTAVQASGTDAFSAGDILTLYLDITASGGAGTLPTITDVTAFFEVDFDT
jgi:hypothetical protein